MATFELTTPDGSKYQIEAESSDLAQRAFDHAFGANTPQPPPGVMIHDTNRSYVVGPEGKPAQSVDTTGMDQGQRNLAAAGLNARRDIPGALQALAPTFQGVSMGYGDEVVSAAKGLETLVRGGSFGSGYDIAQEAQRQALAQERAEHPIRAAAGQIGGALTTLPYLAPLAGAGQGLPLAARMAAGAGIGGALGAVEGFGSGSGMEDRGKQALIGGGMGAAIGGAVPAAVEGAQAVANRAMNSFTVDRNLRNLGLGRPAGDALTRALAADDAFSGAGARNIAGAGPDAMLVDAGPSTRGALDAAMQRGGPATQAARQAVDDRMANATGSLNTALDNTLGVPQGVQSATTDIRQGTAAARDAAYTAAYAAPIDYSHPRAADLESLLSRVPGDAIGKANRLMQLEGEQSNQIMASVAPDGRVTFQRMPDVRQVDYITRGLRQLAEAGEDAGKLGGRTDVSRAYSNLAGNIRSTMRDLVPEYGTALDTAADPISRINAMRFGADLLRPGVARDEVAETVRNMGGPERDALRQGVRSYVDDMMANTRAAASDPNQDAREGIAALRQLNSRSAREKLAAILDPNDAMALSGELARATTAAELYAGTTRNSATYGRMAVDQANKQMQEPGLIGSIMEGKPLQGTQRAMQFVFGRTPQDRLAAEDEMNRQLAAVLTGPRGPDALNTMQTLTGAYRAAPANEALARLLGGYVGAGAGLGAHQGSRSLLGSR